DGHVAFDAKWAVVVDSDLGHCGKVARSMRARRRQLPGRQRNSSAQRRTFTLAAGKPCDPYCARLECAIESKHLSAAAVESHTPATMPDSQFSPRAFRTNMGHDIIAGLVVFLVALPLCLGIAHASGAPLHAGLISGIIGGLVIGSLSG